MCHREVREETVGGKRDRGGTPEIGSINQEEARITVAQTLGVVHGLVGNVKLIMEGVRCSDDWFAVDFLRLVPSDREASMDSIRRDSGMCLAQNRYYPC
jgi:hypothetical protein